MTATTCRHTIRAQATSTLEEHHENHCTSSGRTRQLPRPCPQWASRELRRHGAVESDHGGHDPMTTPTPALGKAVVSLNTGLEDPETVTVAFLVSVGAAEQGRATLMFLTKEAVRLIQPGFAVSYACEGCPPLADLVARYEAAGGSYFACPICLASRRVEPSNMLQNAEPGGTVQLWEWIGAEGATTFSY
jgi:predicted peroxiredoxin